MAIYSFTWQGIGIFQNHLLINHLGQETPVFYMTSTMLFQDWAAQDMDQFHPFQRQLQRRSLAEDWQVTRLFSPYCSVE